MYMRGVGKNLEMTTLSPSNHADSMDSLDSLLPSIPISKALGRSSKLHPVSMQSSWTYHKFYCLSWFYKSENISTRGWLRSFVETFKGSKRSIYVKSLLVSQHLCVYLCVWFHRRTLLMSLSLLLQQYPECLVFLTWLVCEMGGR